MFTPLPARARGTTSVPEHFSDHYRCQARAGHAGTDRTHPGNGRLPSSKLPGQATASAASLQRQAALLARGSSRRRVKLMSRRRGRGRSHKTVGCAPTARSLSRLDAGIGPGRGRRRAALPGRSGTWPHDTWAFGWRSRATPRTGRDHRRFAGDRVLAELLILQLQNHLRAGGARRGLEGLAALPAHNSPSLRFGGDQAQVDPQ